MENIKIDITRAFIDGYKYKLYPHNLMTDLSVRDSIEVVYKDELNKEYKPGQNFVNFEVAKPNIVGFKGVLSVDLWEARILNMRGYEMSGNNIEDFARHPYKYKIRLSLPTDEDLKKELMVDSGMITEEEWNEHMVEPIDHSDGIILAIYPETLSVYFGCWFKQISRIQNECVKESYLYRKLTIPLSKLLDSHYIRILGGKYFDKPVFDPIAMNKKENK